MSPRSNHTHPKNARGAASTGHCDSQRWMRIQARNPRESGLGDVKDAVPFFTSTLESRTTERKGQSAWGNPPIQKDLERTLITGDVREGGGKTTRISSYGTPITTSESPKDFDLSRPLTRPAANGHAFEEVVYTITPRYLSENLINHTISPFIIVC